MSLILTRAVTAVTVVACLLKGTPFQMQSTDTPALLIVNMTHVNITLMNIVYLVYC
jgi:hypothetical protein